MKEKGFVRVYEKSNKQNTDRLLEYKLNFLFKSRYEEC